MGSQPARPLDRFSSSLPHVLGQTGERFSPQSTDEEAEVKGLALGSTLSWLSAAGFLGPENQIRKTGSLEDSGTPATSSIQG